MKLLIVVLILVLLTTVLELIAKQTKCPSPPSGDPNLFSEYQPTQEASQILLELREKRQRGQIISKANYKTVFEQVIRGVPASRMGSWFGVVPKIGADIGFVRDNLPPHIKLLVKRHELEHLLQTGKEKNGEWAANLAVFKEYPRESLRMPVFAIKNKASFYRGRPLCLMINLWQTFKKYLLPLPLKNRPPRG